LSSQEKGEVGNPSIYRCRLIAHDYLFFTTLGFRDTRMSGYIGNYALMYAVNRHIQPVQRNASGTVPSYSEDLPKMAIYATPASVSTESGVPIAEEKMLLWENRPQSYTTFNSVNTLTQLTETGRANLPQIGRKAKHAPLNNFGFFAIGGNPKGIIRLGKKQVSCRIFSSRLTIEREAVGFVRPSHAVNVLDLANVGPEDIKSAELIRQTPPLLINANLRTRYYVCFEGQKTYYVAKPDRDKYQSVSLP